MWVWKVSQTRTTCVFLASDCKQNYSKDLEPRLLLAKDTAQQLNDFQTRTNLTFITSQKILSVVSWTVRAMCVSPHDVHAFAAGVSHICNKRQTFFPCPTDTTYPPSLNPHIHCRQRQAKPAATRCRCTCVCVSEWLCLELFWVFVGMILHFLEYIWEQYDLYLMSCLIF